MAGTRSATRTNCVSASSDDFPSSSQEANSSVGSGGFEPVCDVEDPQSWVVFEILTHSSVFREGVFSTLSDFQGLVGIDRKEEWEVLCVLLEMPVCNPTNELESEDF